MWGFLRRKETGGQSVEQIAAAIEGESGVTTRMSDREALGISTVFACLDVICNSVAVPELYLMRDLGSGAKEKATDDPLFRLLRRRPNEWQTSLEFRQMVTAHAALRGEGYVLPVRDVRDKRKVVELLPLMPHWVTREQTERYGERYRVADEYGLMGVFDRSELLIIKNFAWTHLQTLAPVRQVAAAMGLARAAEANLAELHASGGQPHGILSTDSEVSPEVVENVKARWRMLWRRGKSKIALLDNGFKFHPLAMTATDAQAQETRRMQVEEICRGFGVFPIMVGHADKSATYASVEAFLGAHRWRTGRRWQRIWVENLDEFVIDGSGPLFAEFDNQETTTATLRDQSEFFSRALGVGGGVPFMTVNEVRELRGLPPKEGGDKLPDPVTGHSSQPNDDTDQDPDPADEGDDDDDTDET